MSNFRLLTLLILITIITSLSYREKQHRCAHRRCCHTLRGIQNKKCKKYNFHQCSIHSESCYWECDKHALQQRIDHKIRQNRTKYIKYIGKANRHGIFSENLLQTIPESSKKVSVIDLQKYLTTISIDTECDDEFEEIEDIHTAQMDYDLDHQKNIINNITGKIPKKYNLHHRRISIIDENELTSIHTKWWPESHFGLITFDADDTTYWCSGSKISYKHILTAGHCCHGGGVNQGWYSNWIWKGGITTLSEAYDEDNGVKIIKAQVLNGWLSESEWDYDMCILTLEKSSDYYFGYGYDNTNEQVNWAFDYSGYPASMSSRNAIKYKYNDCYPSFVHENQFYYKCDTAGGLSGAGLLKDGTDMLYGVHSWGHYFINGGCRITPSKFEWIRDIIAEGNGYTLD